MINTQLVESLAQVIRSLSWEERFLLEENYFGNRQRSQAKKLP